jgi:Co/Zn/Cd efflux system component
MTANLGPEHLDQDVGAAVDHLRRSIEPGGAPHHPEHPQHRGNALQLTELDLEGGQKSQRAPPGRVVARLERELRPYATHRAVAVGIGCRPVAGQEEQVAVAASPDVVATRDRKRWEHQAEGRKAILGPPSIRGRRSVVTKVVHSVQDTDVETTGERRRHLDRGLRLEVLTVAWNVVEAVIAIGAGIAAGSVALLGFGVDSVVESASGTVLLWRLLAERRNGDVEAVERVERIARRLVAASLLALAVYIAFESVTSLAAGDQPDASPVGIALAAASLAVMWWLARQKYRVARALGSRAMRADAFQTDACFWLSLFLLVGLGLNALFGWWWADPVAALGMTLFIGREALEAWRGEDEAAEAEEPGGAAEPETTPNPSS